MTVMVGTNPSADQYGRTRRVLGPYCCSDCVIAVLRRSPEQVNIGHLMTQKPAGSDGT